MDIKNTTVVICCAGMGSRLGIGTTKALVRIEGKPIIIRLLEQLSEFDDIRIVVGFQAEKVIDVVNSYRKDIMFAFNYDYKTTGVAASLNKGSLGARKYIIAIDGDLLVNTDDFREFLECDGECIAITNPNSSEPILMTVEDGNVIEFSKRKGNKEWPGLVKIKSHKIRGKKEYVYELIAELLPLRAQNIRSREIDTAEDYEKAVEWVEKGCID